MAYNRNILYVPTAAASLARADIYLPLAPASLPVLPIALDVETYCVARFSNGEIAVIDSKNGRLVRLTAAGAIVWNVDCREAAETPCSVVVDKNDDVWVGFYGGGKNAKFRGTDGVLLGRVEMPVPADAILQASNANYILAYDDIAGMAALIDIASITVYKYFTIQSKSPDHEPCPINQVGMFDTKYYIPARRKATATLNPGKYEILQFTDDTLLSVLPLTWPKALTGTIADVAGKAYAMDEFSSVFEFTAAMALRAVYALESQGRLCALALDNLAGVLYAVSDDLMGGARIHAIDPSTGVPTYLGYAPGGFFEGGDLSGYIRGTVIAEPDVPLLPPVVDTGKIAAPIFPTETVVTGKPGAVQNAVSVSCAVGTATIEQDGSFAIHGAPVAPGPITLTFTGPGGSTPVVVTAIPFAATATGARFVGTTFGLDGGYLKIYLEAAGLPLTTGTHFLRIKDNGSGLYWNGLNFVVSNGLFLEWTHDEVGVWLHHFVLPAGDYTVFFEEGTVFGNEELLVSPEKTQTAEILSKVNQLGAPGAPFLAPANLLATPGTIGEYMATSFGRIQFLLNVLGYKARLVFPRAVEGIAAVVSRVFIKTGDTPLIAFTILDSVTGQPKDITGHTLHFRARTQPGGILVFDRILTHVDSRNGQADVRLTTADTDTSGSFVAEVEETSPDGVVLSTVTFNFTVSPDLT